MTSLRGRTIRFFKFIALAFLLLFFSFAAFVGYLAVYKNTPLQLPAPDGSYPIGRIEFDWVDSSSPDPLADKGSAPRELVVWVWYSAASAGTNSAPYLPANWVQAREADQGVGILIEHNLSLIQTHSFEGAPLASTPNTFPVLVMEPGMGPMATDYTVFAENLASHGYIVVGINPTDTANWTVFPDGRVVLRSTRGTIPDRDTIAEAIVDGNRILAVWSQDEQFVMDRLAKMNTDQISPFYLRLDLEHIGLWGHSFGGASALAVCQQDARCKAGVDMDGTPMSGEAQAPVPRPFMFMTEDYGQGCDKNCEAIRQVYQHIQPGEAYLISIEGTRHFNFSDLPYRQLPVFRHVFTLAGFAGTIQPDRGLQVVNDYLTAFFDQYLKGTQEGLLRGPSANYPEVRIERR
jgi:predicted dienelactone hydrolase